MSRLCAAIIVVAVLVVAGSARAGQPATPTPPACEEPGFRQLDFWLGDWDVVIRARAAPGSDQWAEAHGTNHVGAPLGRCVVQESFRADGPGAPWAGQSVSMYVPKEHAWRHSWVDDGGNFLAFRGGPEPGGLFALYGEPREVGGARVQMRMVFRNITHDAFVWSWERGTVGGASWTPMMEIRYTRQRPAPRAGAACDSDPSFHDLDFWLGDWTVVADGKTVGTNRIEKTLGGCAVVERWKASDGGEGQSLFYHPPGSSTWKQVWLTPQATSIGGAKEKLLVARLPGGALRFEGELPLPGGHTLFDRTTLTPLDGGRVRQLIETSRDRGATWKPSFDAVYRK